MASFDDRTHEIFQAGVLACLPECLPLLEKSRAFHSADDSFPSKPTHRRKSWRCISLPRIGLLIAGRHDIAFVKNSVTVEAQMHPGDLWFLPANTHDDEMFLHKCTYISAVFFQNYTRFVIISNDGPSHHYPAPAWFHRHEERPAAIKATLAALNHICGGSGNDTAGAHLCRALWAMLFDWIQTDEPRTQPPLGKANVTWLAIDRFMQENYHRLINRRAVADSLQLHPNRISELCRRFGGDTFQHILEKQRLNQAKRFLEKSDAKIEAVALMCGFSGVTYFTRVFGRATGMSPGRWRGTHGRQCSTAHVNE